ncbi:MAG: sigma-54-dependent Fis family transcriptional regulator [Zetaproteobacteria bacterium CG2_30_46_52]|nr:MAG: sigma-54-dependent Fis family transcriptional regulator [Zetaproteobacteria bacterium CG2_30_46_52]
MQSALIVDDDDGIRWVLNRVLKEQGFEVIEAPDLATAKAAMEEHTFSIVFLDVFLPDGNGMQALEKGMFHAPVIMLTAETTFDHAVEAYRAGAMEYLPKPFDLDEVRSLVNRVKAKDSAKQKKKTRVTTKQDSFDPQDKPKEKTQILGKSQAMQQLYRIIGRVAASDMTVLITGESGTGKELIAQELHKQSLRTHKAFIAINTAAIPAELLEAELFGHEKGAFTGADKARAGHFEHADGGTLFLDEIGDMPLALQAKMLRVLETGEVQRVGSTITKKVNVRLLAATHQYLPKKIKAGLFREDLYYRLNVIPVHIPPLRERRDDIPDLAEALLSYAAEELGITAPILMPDAITLLQRFDWQGNVRELKNVMRRLAVLTPGASITMTDVALALGNGEDAPNDGDETLSEAVHRCVKRYLQQLGYAEVEGLYRHVLDQVEPPILRLVLEKAEGNQLKVAEMLGLNRNTVRKLLKTYDIDAVDFKR